MRGRRVRDPPFGFCRRLRYGDDDDDADGQAMSAEAQEDTTHAAPVTALSPLSIPMYRKVWWASMASNLGGVIQSVGAAWMMVSLAQSADMVALVQASTALPIMLFSLMAGAMADNLDRRRVMLAAQVFMLLVSAALALFAWSGALTPWLLLLFTFLIGCGNAFNAPAWQASVGEMVPRPQLPGAVALNSIGFNLARSFGPALGGLIVAGVGAAATFALNALSYIPLLVVLRRWRPVVEERLLPAETLAHAMAAGVRYVALSPAIRSVLLRATVFGLGASAVMALMPLVARDLIAGGPLAFGLLLGAFGAGAIGGALAAARLRRLATTENIVRGACVGFALTAALTATSASLPTTMAVMVLGGASWVLALSNFNVAVQLSAPRWVVARALSLYQMAAFGGIAVGSWIWGGVAAFQGVGTALVAASIFLLACAVLGLWVPLAQTEDLNLAPLRRWEAPPTAVPVEPRTGPVVVTIEWIIREEDILEFLKAMAERRRIRRRDGALAWALLRDLADPTLWIERYKLPTWLDYIRLNNRVTQDDAVIPERLRALHRGPEEPRVRRMIERQTSSAPAAPPPGSSDAIEPHTDPTAH